MPRDGEGLKALFHEPQPSHDRDRTPIRAPEEATMVWLATIDSIRRVVTR